MIKKSLIFIVAAMILSACATDHVVYQMPDPPAVLMQPAKPLVPIQIPQKADTTAVKH